VSLHCNHTSHLDLRHNGSSDTQVMPEMHVGDVPRVHDGKWLTSGVGLCVVVFPLGGYACGHVCLFVLGAPLHVLVQLLCSKLWTGIRCDAVRVFLMMG
jgi:hypothetical protein